MGRCPLLLFPSEVTFPYKGSLMKGCQKDIPSPSSKQKECQRFLKLALHSETYLVVDAYITQNISLCLLQEVPE